MQNQAADSAFDIIVVGAGMVGLTAALAFLKSGFKVLVIEARDQSAIALPDALTEPYGQCAVVDSFDNKVSALTCASTQILKNLNVWPKIASLRCQPYRHMKVWDGQGSGKIDFSSAQLYEDNLGHIVENSVALAALLDTAHQQQLDIIDSAKVLELSEYNSQTGLRQLKCQVEGTSFDRAYNKLFKNSADQSAELIVSAPLIVGADGAMSKIRQLSAVPLWQWDYGHHALVATVETEQPHQQTAWQRFTEDGPLAFLPLSQPHFSSIVWSTSPQHAKELLAMDPEPFQDALAQGFEHKLGKVVNFSKRAVFPLRQRQAKYYVQQGLALIGDTIHTIHPLAGQGVNLGLLDAAALAQVLAVAKQRRQDISSLGLLKKYQRMRQSENLKMSAAMQGFKWLFDEQSAPLVIARNAAMSLLNQAGPVKQHIIMQAMGLSGELPELAQRKTAARLS